MKKILSIFMTAILLSACSVDTVCRQDLNIEMGVTFIGDSLHWAGDSIGYEHVSITSLKGLRVWGMGRDSLLCDTAQTVSTLYLPLRKDTDDCAFCLSLNGLQDTLFCRYTRKQTYVSLACGCAVFSTLDSVWTDGALIDSVFFVNQSVSTTRETHLKVYLTYPQ